MPKNDVVLNPTSTDYIQRLHEIQSIDKRNSSRVQEPYSVPIKRYKAEIEEYLERATLPHCLHFGLLSPRRVFGGVSVRFGAVLTVAAATGAEVEAEAVAVVVEEGAEAEADPEAVAISEALLVRAGETAAMKAKSGAWKVWIVRDRDSNWGPKTARN